MGTQNNANATPTRVLYSIEEARQRLGGISRSGIYNLVKSGQLKLTKLGRRSLISDKEIQRCADEAS